MSGLDPLAAFAAQIVANAQAAIEEAALDLGAATKALQAQLNLGDIITATVLPPENGGDRLELFGQTVAARLPPGVNPGEQLQLQVTGFTNAAIVVRNLGVVDPQNPPPPLDVQLSPPAPGAPQSAILRTDPQPASAASPASPASPAVPSAQQTPPAAAPSESTPPLAPPREIFVAASVVPNATPPLPDAEMPRAPLASQAAAPAELPGDVEARIALNRTARELAPQASPARPPAAAPPAAARPLAAPRPPAAPAAPPPTIPARPAPPRAAPSAIPLLRGAREPASAESALLARVRVPVTATTLAAARVVKTATQTLTNAFERLDSALAKLAPDPRVGTLRSLLSFVGKFDLRAPAALPEQIAAFLSHVVDGPEGKFAQLARVYAPIAPSDLPPALALPDAPAGQTPAQSPAHAQALPASPAQATAAEATNAAAHAAERVVALEHDVKSALLALVQNPPRDASPAIVQAVRDALVATTAVQVNVLSAQSSDPNAVTIPLPAYFYDGGKPAQLRITREAPGSARALDADNFHIGFVLDTKHLGTVAIDVQTVGRAVSVDVKTQTHSFADRFRTTLADLRGRLESLRYRVAAIDAGAAPAGQTASVPPQFENEPRTANERASTWDMRA